MFIVETHNCRDTTVKRMSTLFLRECLLMYILFCLVSSQSFHKDTCFNNINTCFAWNLVEKDHASAGQCFGKKILLETLFFMFIGFHIFLSIFYNRTKQVTGDNNYNQNIKNNVSNSIFFPHSIDQHDLFPPN